MGPRYRRLFNFHVALALLVDPPATSASAKSVNRASAVLRYHGSTPSDRIYLGRTRVPAFLKFFAGFLQFWIGLGAILVAFRVCVLVGVPVLGVHPAPSDACWSRPHFIDCPSAAAVEPSPDFLGVRVRVAPAGGSSPSTTPLESRVHPGRIGEKPRKDRNILVSGHLHF